MLDELVERSKKILTLAADMSKTYYDKPLIITYSGGKDSDVLLHLAESCLKPDEFEVLNSHTTVDAPETVYHIRETFERLRGGGIETETRQYHYPEATGDRYTEYRKSLNGKAATMWNLIPIKRIPPTRLARYCCQVLKETGTPNRIAALGVRASESVKRQGRDVFGVRGGSYRQATFFSLDHTEEVHHEAKDRDPVWDCTLIKVMREHGDTVVNPIYEWTDSDIWEYINENHIKINPLYECGYHRVGCIGCPLATYKQKQKEFADYPKYKDAYIRAFDRMVSEIKTKGREDVLGKTWTDGEAVFNWWIEEGKRNVKGQLSFDFEGKIKED